MQFAWHKFLATEFNQKWSKNKKSIEPESCDKDCVCPPHFLGPGKFLTSVSQRVKGWTSPPQLLHIWTNYLLTNTITDDHTLWQASLR